VRLLLRIAAGALFLVVLALAALWTFKPWVPPLQMTPPGEHARRIETEDVVGNLHLAETSSASPGVLLLGGSEGGLGAGVDRVARALRRAGFSVLHLSYFRAPGQPESLELVPLETLVRGLEALRHAPEVDPDRIGLVGVSKGAEAALLLAVRAPEVRAVVLGLPSSVAWMGIDWSRGGSGDEPSWTWRGEPVPHLPYGDFDPSVGMASVYRGGLQKLGAHPEAIIPVEEVQAPLLLVCGEADAIWPSCRMSRQIEQRASEKGGPPVTLLAYEDAGHAAFGVPIPESASGYPHLADLGGTAEGNARARREAWPKTLDFLRAHLAASPSPEGQDGDLPAEDRGR
jgi:hypothetical protein